MNGGTESQKCKGRIKAFGLVCLAKQKEFDYSLQTYEGVDTQERRVI